MAGKGASGIRRGNRFSVKAVTIFALFIIIYSSLPPLLTLLQPTFRGEVYPLSMWSMFYKVHNTMEDVGIRVTSVKGKSLKRPTYFEDAKYKHSKKVSAYHAIQKFGRAATAAKKHGLRAGRLPPSVLKARQQFEAAWLRKAQVQYELVHRRWNPYERIQAKKFQQQKVLYSFESKKWSDQ